MLVSGKTSPYLYYIEDEAHPQANSLVFVSHCPMHEDGILVLRLNGLMPFTPNYGSDN